eukprot:scaffold24515_cov112-Isochrysis_galbana.AAC.5
MAGLSGQTVRQTPASGLPRASEALKKKANKPANRSSERRVSRAAVCWEEYACACTGGMAGGGATVGAEDERLAVGSRRGAVCAAVYSRALMV